VRTDSLELGVSKPFDKASANGRGKWACVALGLLLVADAVFLMVQDVFSLGVTLPFVIGVALLALGLQWVPAHRWLDARPGRRIAWRWMWLGVLIWAFSVAGFWAVLALAGSEPAGATAPAAIVVLGSGAPKGKASPVLAARLDLALQQAAHYPQAVVVVSGGVDFGETRSEAQVMGDYLREAGLPAGRIVQEEKSSSTEQNLLFSKPLLAQRGVSPAQPVQLVTSDFHTLRARWIARSAGYGQVSLAGAPTPLYVRYNAWLREYFAVLSGFVLREF
jgi:uncharacterized SAM-binding protein YcdF (DUF218 family)